MKYCEYCIHWSGPGFASLMQTKDGGNEMRHFVDSSELKNHSGYCERYPQKTETKSFSTCGEFAISERVIDVLSSALRNLHKRAKSSDSKFTKMKKERDSARRTSSRLKEKTNGR